jgi:hypothetical protein
MPRKDFLADLEKLASVNPDEISKVRKVDDGEFEFCLHLSEGEVKIIGLIIPGTSTRRLEMP